MLEFCRYLLILFCRGIAFVTFYRCYEKIRTSFNFRCSHYGQGEYILSQNNKSTDSESLASKVCAFIIYSGFPYTVRTRKSQNKKSAPQSVSTLRRTLYQVRSADEGTVTGSRSAWWAFRESACQPWAASAPGCRSRTWRQHRWASGSRLHRSCGHSCRCSAPGGCSGPRCPSRPDPHCGWR